VTAMVTEATVRTELCRAFAALVQAYATLAAFHDGRIAEFEQAGGGLRVEVDGAQLKLHFDPLIGAGEWHISGPSGADKLGCFQLQSDGTIALDGAITEMDHAAIDLSALLKKSWGEKR
jgi:hypothetical protein